MSVNDRGSLSVEVRDYEPALALFSGVDGLEIFRSLIPAAFDALIPGGFIVLEIGYGQSPALRTLLRTRASSRSNSFPTCRTFPASPAHGGHKDSPEILDLDDKLHL